MSLPDECSIKWRLGQIKIGLVLSYNMAVFDVLRRRTVAACPLTSDFSPFWPSISSCRRRYVCLIMLLGGTISLKYVRNMFMTP